jgi:putative DNA primase/helicase
MAQRIWDSAQDARGSPVVRYLAGRRITIALPPTLRYAPALRRPDGGSGPAMVALVEHIEHGTVGVHRTWLARDEAAIWRRRDRASLGPIAGGAVRLAAAAETLMIGEGLETCLSAVQATGMPAWAALSTSGLRALVLPPIVREILILADNDANWAGAAAAHDAARRWLSEGRAVRLAMPPDLGDFNDVLIAGTEPRHVAA